ncbi:hypothetical protein [Vibrio rarus]|uniref:hypothetical protein n=1 Tax=Vibrio rarus TaxID=413403 RepID=UPI0021C2E653|nr:hypothetical protein [Vibrio rarus]
MQFNILKVITICFSIAASATASAGVKNHFMANTGFAPSQSVALDSQCGPSQFDLPTSLLVKPGALTDVVMQSNVQFLRGIEDPYLYESGYTYDQVKGKFFLDTHWLCEIKQQGSHPALWIVPSIVTTSGSGVFYYLDVNERKADHYSIAQELFLGDRIKIESLVYHHGVVELSFKQHSLHQAMAEHPNELITKRFVIKGNQLVDYSE